jgi:hypothetical protein
MSRERRRRRLGRTGVVAVVGFLAGWGTVGAEEPVWHRQVWVPARELDKVLAGMSRAVMLSPAEYEALVRQAGPPEGPPGPATETVPVEAVLRRLELRGVAGESCLDLTAGYEWESLRPEGRVAVPLPAPHRDVAGFTGGEGGVVLRAGDAGRDGPVVQWEGAGRRTLEARFLVPVQRSGNRFEAVLAPLPAAAGSLRLVFPAESEVTANAPFQTLPDGVTRRFGLPASGEPLKIGWKRSGAGTLVPEAVRQQGRIRFLLEEGRVRAEMELRLLPGLGRLPDDLVFPLAEGWQVVDASGPGAGHWSVNGGRLTVRYPGGGENGNVPADLRLVLEAEGLADGSSSGRIRLPVPVATVAGRAEGRLWIFAAPSVRVDEAVFPPEFVAMPGGSYGAACVAAREFAMLGADFPEVRLRRRSGRVHVRVDTLAEVGADGIRLRHEVTMEVREGERFEAAFRLGEGERLERVEAGREGEPIRPGTGEPDAGNEGTVTVSWPRGLAPGRPGRCVLVTRRDLAGTGAGAGPEVVRLHGLGVEADHVDGSVVVATSPEWAAVARNVSGMAAVDPARTGASGRLAWRRSGTCRVDLELSRLRPEFDVHVTSRAVPEAGRLETEGRLDLSIRHSALRELGLQVDAELLGAMRFSSPWVAEQIPVPEEGVLVLRFHEGLTGFRRLDWRASLPIREERSEDEGIRFEAELPRIGVREAKRLTGQWYVGAPADTTLEFAEGQAKRFEIPAVTPWADGDEAPRMVAAFDHAGPDHGIRVRGFRHVARPVEALVVRRLRIHSTVFPDGRELHDTEWTLENRAAAGLGLVFPHDGEILDLSVDGVVQRPVLTGPPIPGTAIRLHVRLPRGEAVTLRVVHARRGVPWSRSGEISLRPVETEASLPVLDTEWRVHVPEGYRWTTTATDFRHRSAAPEEALLAAWWRQAGPQVERWVAGRTGRGSRPASSSAEDSGAGAGGTESAKGRGTPVLGRMLLFQGFQPPSTIRLAYLSGSEAVRGVWVWVLTGMVCFWMLAGNRPLLVGLFGVALLTFLPVSGITDLATLANGLLVGWGVALVGSQSWRACRALAEAGGPRWVPSGRGAPGTVALALAAGWVGAGPGGNLGAQESAPAAPPDPDLVVVPYDERLPLESQKPRSVYVDTRTFERWWERAARARGERPPEAAPGGQVWAEGWHDAVRQERGLAVTARYRLHVAGPEWVRVPFSFSGAVLRSTRIDGEPASWDADGLIARSAGWHVVEVEYEVPFGTEGDRDVRWQVPAAAAAALRLRGHLPGETITVNDGAPLAVSREDGAETVTAALGARREIAVSWAASARAPAVDRPRLARVETDYELRPGLRRLEARIRWEFPGQRIRSFAVDLDPAFGPVELRASGLETWRLVRPQGDAVARLELDLVRPAEGEFALEVHAEAPGAFPDGPSPLPRLVPDAARADATWSVWVRGPWEARFQGGEKVSAPAAAAAEGLAGAFRWDGADRGPELTLVPSRARPEARVQAVHFLASDHQEAVFQVRLRLAGGERQSRVTLPAGCVVRELVPGPGLGDWWRDGDLLRFQAGAGGGDVADMAFLLVLEMPRTAEAAADGTGRRHLPDLDWPDGTDLESEVVVAASAGEATELAGSALHAVEPDAVLPGVVVLPPFERKHAFRHAGAGNGMTTVTGSRTAPVFEAGVVMSAVVKDTWVQLAFHLDLEVKRSTLPSVTVLAPPELPELRWEGAGLREVRPAEGGRERGYTLVFHEEVATATSLTATAELPLVRGGVRLPRLSVPEARQLVQFAVLETSLPGGLETNLARVEEVPADQVPFVPPRMDRPRFFRMIGAEWFFGVGLTKAETLAGAEATVTESEIITALRENGEEWHHVVYRLRNQSLRFLPVRLPPGMEVVRVRVSSREVRPRAGEGETLLIPLEPSAPEDFASVVELVYRRPAAPDLRLQDRFRRSLQAPVLALDGRAEAQTFWRLHLPAGYTGHKIGGPVHPVPPSQRSVALVNAHLDELGRLAQVARSRVAGGVDALPVWNRVRSLAGLTRERLLPEASLGPDGPRLLADWERELAALEQEADAAAAPAPAVPEPAPRSADASTAGSERFVPNQAAVRDRLRRLREAEAALAQSLRGMVRLNDHLALREEFLDGTPGPSQRVPTGASGEGPEADAPFAAASENLRDTVRAWEAERISALGAGSRTRRFEALPSLRPGPAAAPAPLSPGTSGTGASPEATEPGPDADALRKRLLPDVEFPLEGDPMVFHKVKGNASLEIEGNRVRGSAVPMAWAWFLAVLAVIRFFAWLTGPARSARPAGVRPGAPPPRSPMP